MIVKTARKLVVSVIGGTVVLLGVIMLVTPGQGVLTILLGLAILATEFVWAKLLLDRVKRESREAVQRYWPWTRQPVDDVQDTLPEKNTGANAKEKV